MRSEVRFIMHPDDEREFAKFVRAESDTVFVNGPKWKTPEARKVAALAATLSEKLEAQKLIRTLESTRKERRKKLFDSQDEIDSRRDELIARIEIQLGQKQALTPLFTIRWKLN